MGGRDQGNPDECDLCGPRVGHNKMHHYIKSECTGANKAKFGLNNQQFRWEIA